MAELWPRPVPTAELLVVQQPTGAWAWSCPTHGLATFQWWDQSMATFDAIGHAAHHHPPTASRE